MAAELIAESRVRRPPVLLQPYVEHYVGYHYAGFEAGAHMGLPSRHLTFVISFDAKLELSVQPDGSPRRTAYDALIGGFHTSPAVIDHDGNQHGIQLSVTPAGARTLFGMPAGELAARSCRSTRCGAGSPSSCSTVSTARRPGSIASPCSTGSCCAPCRRASSCRRARPGQRRPRRGDGWWRRPGRSTWRRSPARSAGAAGTSPTSSRRSTGSDPKAMARVLRFERARWMIVRPDRPTLATVAAECGYADQAHMTRDFQALAGASPMAWIAAEHLPFVQDEEPVDGARWTA